VHSPPCTAPHSPGVSACVVGWGRRGVGGSGLLLAGVASPGWGAGGLRLGVGRVGSAELWPLFAVVARRCRRCLLAAVAAACRRWCGAFSLLALSTVRPADVSSAVVSAYSASASAFAASASPASVSVFLASGGGSALPGPGLLPEGLGRRARCSLARLVAGDCSPRWLARRARWSLASRVFRRVTKGKPHSRSGWSRLLLSAPSV
jgi:hypothetical protein